MKHRGKCPHCGTKYVEFTVKHAIDKVRESGAHIQVDMLAKCSYCDRGVLLMYFGPRYSIQLDSHNTKIAPSPPDTNAPSYTPENVANYFRQAMENMSGNYDAAGGMFRKTIETALGVKFGKLDENLGKFIKAAAEKGWLTKDMADWSDEVRLGGNKAVHEIEPFSKEDAEKLKDFTNLLLCYMFTLPGMLQQAKKRSKDDDSQE